MVEVLLVLKKGGDVSAFRKELDRAVGERAHISALVSTRSLEIKDLDETVEKEEVVSALCLALGRPALDGSCRPFIRFGGMKTAVIQLAEADATRLLQLGKIGIGWVRAAYASMRKSPDASGALAMVMGPGAAVTPTGRIPVKDTVSRET